MIPNRRINVGPTSEYDIQRQIWNFNVYSLELDDSLMVKTGG